MTRQTSPGTIQDAVAKAYDAAGGVTTVSRFLGIAQSTASYGTEVNEARPGGIGVSYLEKLAMWKPECAAPIAQHFAELGGGVFQPVLPPNVSSLHENAGTTTKEFGEALQAMICFAQNPSPKTLAISDREIDDVVSYLLAHKAAQRNLRESGNG